MFPYGTQYYRTPNPPEGEWEKDFDNIVSQGFTLVKIWAMWNWINYEEDKYDFAHFDTLFELARKNGLKILINVILENAPYWLIHRHRDAFYVASNGEPFEPIARPNTPGGGWPGLCLDSAPVKLEAEKFLKALGARYAHSDVLWGYDVWNEVFFELYGYTGFENRQFCYCEGSRQLFVEWLKRRYGTLDQLNKAWYRRYSDWAEVYPPRYLGSYPDWLDWLRFRIETRKDLMRWRVQTLRSVDKKHQLISHGVGWTLHSMPTYLTNDFDIAQEVDQWGLSLFPMWGNMDAGEYCRSLDLVRSASAQYGKRWWQSELQGGQSSMGLVRSRIPRGEDIAQWNWLAFMVGAKGLMYWQWRPELLGPESPGFGLCKLDGSRTDRTETASWFSRFMNSHPELEQAEALAGECAIVVVPESQLFAYLADSKTDAYWKSVYGIYRALWNVNVQVDFCTLDRVNNYPLVFLPFPLMLEEWQVDKLKDYVSRGGVLVSDAAPAHFIDHGYCSFTIPGAGLDEVFGAVEDEMEYVPTLTLGDVPPPAIVWKGMKINCRIYQEKLIPTAGSPVAYFTDGTVAVVDHNYGNGKTRLIGSFPGIEYTETLEYEAELFIRDALSYAGIKPRIEILDQAVKARIHRSATGDFLWVVNTDYQEITTEIRLQPTLDKYSSAENLVTAQIIPIRNQSLSVTLPALAGAVYKLA